MPLNALTVVRLLSAITLLLGVAPSAAAQAPWRLVEEARFGTGNDPRTELSHVLGVAVSKDRSVLVEDGGRQSIIRFASDGRYLLSLGGRGAGPGEFSAMTAFGRAPDGTLWINDPGNNRISVHREDGTFVRTISTNNYDRLQVPVRPDAQGRWLVEVIRNPRAAAIEIAAQRRAADGTVMDTLAVPDCPAPEKPPTRTWIVKGRPLPVPLVARGVSLFTTDGAIWCSPGYVYRVTKLRLGAGDTLNDVRGMRASSAYAKPTRDSAIAGVRESVAKLGGTMSEVHLDEIPTTQPPVMGLVEDDQRRLWVMVPPPSGAGTQFDVYAAGGRLAARASASAVLYRYFPPLIIGKMLYAVVRDEDDVPTVVRYRIVTGR